MKQVSNAYKVSMKSMLRNRSYVRVILYNEDTTAAGDGSWSSNGAASISNFSHLDEAHQYTGNYATFELNRWLLDGGFTVVPDSGADDGFVSSMVADENGTLANQATVTKTFTTPHTIPGLTLVFDTRADEWPAAVMVDFYLNGSIVKEVAVAVTSSTVSFETQVEACDKFTITFGDTLPYRRPRLERVGYGTEKYFENNDIVSAYQSHDVDPLSRRLPKETMEFTLLDYEKNYNPDNPKGVYKFIDEKSAVSIQFGYELPDGTIEWVKSDNYILTGRPTAANYQAVFNATGLIGSMTKYYYKSTAGSKTFYDMAEDVLIDADLPIRSDGKDPWVIDETLKSLTTTAVLPIDTHANCLQLIAHACCCRLYSDDDNIIHIERFGVTKTGLYSGEYSDSGHAWFSSTDDLDSGVTGDTVYATLELNRWILDGSQMLPQNKETPSAGYLSNVLSNDEGEFFTVPTLTRTFDVTRDCRVISLRFDTKMEEWPFEVEAELYSGDTLLDTVIAEVTSTEVTLKSDKGINCTKIIVKANGTMPYRRFRVEKVSFSETDFVVDFNTVSQNSQTMTKIDRLQSVTVERHTYTADDNTSTLYECSTAETTLHVEFDAAQDISVSVTGGSVASSSVYAQAADLTLSSGTKNVVITGKKLSDNCTVYTLPVSTSGEVDAEQNPLITNDTMCADLAAHIAAYLQMRNTYDVSYRGNPELEVGDIIQLETDYTSAMDGLVLVDEITFGGSLSGKLKVKALI